MQDVNHQPGRLSARRGFPGVALAVVAMVLAIPLLVGLLAAFPVGAAPSEPAVEVSSTTITGKVWDPTGTSGVGNAIVLVARRDSFVGWGVSLSNPQPAVGTFAVVPVTSLADGTYVAVAVAPDGVAYASSLPVTFTITGGNVSPQLLVLRLTAVQVSGQVGDPSGAVFAFPAAYNRDRPAVILTSPILTSTRFGVTSQDGSFKFGGLADGPYRLWALAPFSGTASSYANSDRSELTLAGGAPVGNVNPRLVAPTISGTVVAPDGRIVPNAEAILVPRGADPVESKGSATPGQMSTTNVRGEFRFGTLVTNTYNLWVFAPPYGEFREYAAAGPVAVSYAPGAAPQWLGPITLTTAMLKGTVKTPDGSAGVPDILVQLRPQMGHGGRTTATDGEGKFAIPPVPDGTYLLEVYPPPSSMYVRPQPTQIVVSDGRAEPDSVDVRLATPQLTGTVKTPQGAAVPYAGVVARSTTGMVYPTVADGLGAFRLGSLPNGTYSLQAMPPAGTGYGKSSPVTVTVSGGVATPGSVDLVLTATQITGVVEFPPAGSGTPAVGAVAVLRTSDRSHQESAPVGPNGQFGFGGLADGTYLLSAEPPSGSDLTRSAEVTITVSGGTASPPSATLTLGEPQLRGELRTPDGAAVSRGFVALHTRDFTYATGAPVDPMGRFRFGGLQDGTYILEGQPAPGDPYSPAQPATVTVAAGQASPSFVPITLSVAALTGTVRAPSGEMDHHSFSVGSDDGAPVTRATVNLQSEDGRLRFSTGVNQFGQFAFGRLPDAAYRIEAVPAPDTGFGPSERESVKVVGGRADRSGITLWVGRPVITGTVKTPNGLAPVSQAFVTLRSRDDRFHGGTSVGVDGRFALGKLDDGEYVIEAIPAPTTGFGPSGPVTVTIRSGVPSRTNIELRVSRPTVTGAVVTPEGMGLPSASVQLHTSDFRYRQGSFTGPRGEFVLGGVPDGDYVAEAFPPPESDFTPSRPLTVTVRDQTPVSVRITVTLPSISGTVVGPDGQEVEHAFVEVHNRDRSIQRAAPTGDDGRFKVGGLPTGQYLLRAMPSPGTNYAPSREMTVTVTAGALTDVGLVVLQPVQVMGRLVNPEGRPLPSAGVTLATPDRSFHQDFGADLGGVFRVGGLPAGTYVLEARLPFEAGGLIPPEPITLTIPLADPNLGDIAFRSPTKSVVGSVVRSTGGTVGGALVFANRQSPPAFAAALTDGGGIYRLEVGGGTWAVGVSNDPRRGGTGSDWISDQPPTQVTFADDTTVQVRRVDFTVTVANSLVSGQIAMPNGSAPFSNTVFVSLRDQSGRGNGAPLSADGSFRIRVPAGTYRLDVRTTRSDLYAPTQSPITIGSAETVDIGTITLRYRSSTISGTVRDQGGNGVAGIHVRAWLVGGGEFASAASITDGIYSLAVISGTWDVQAQPGPDSSYRPYGSPARVTIGDGEERQAVGLEVVALDAVLTGRLLDAGLHLLDDAHGFVYVLRGTGADTRMVAGGPLRDGVYQIAVPSGAGYRVGVAFPPDSSYVTEEQGGVIVVQGETKKLDLTARAANAAIAGSLRDTTGTAVTGIQGHVYAGSPFGQRNARIDPSTGAYAMTVVAGTWYLNAAVPDESGYAVRPAENNAVTVQAGQAATFDVTVARADAAVVGTVTDPSGTALGGAWVWASTRPTSTTGGPPRFVAGDVTRRSGAYTLTLPAGDYEIRAALPKDRGLIEPSPATVTLATGNTATANLQFRAASLTITGVVTLDGTPHRASVMAFARGGARAEASAGDDGQYQLAVAGNDTWYVEARTVDNNVLFQSPLLTVTVASTSVTGQNLALATRGTLPTAESVSFDAGTMQTILLSDGTRISIPAGALAISGTVTVRAAPKGEIPIEAQRRPIGLAYELSAVDADNQPIEQFLETVSIILPYTDTQLAALGITADDLIPAYWDPDTGSWRPVDNVVVDEVAHTVTIMTDHFTDFAILGSQSTPASTTTKWYQYLPTIWRKATSQSW